MIRNFALLLKSGKYLIPIFSFISLCKLALYYYMFNIRISHYISLSEILTPFLGDLLFYLLVFIIPSFIFIIFFGKAIGQSNILKFKKDQELTNKQRFKRDLKTSWPLWLVFISFLVGYFMNRTKPELLFANVIVVFLLPFAYWIRYEMLIRSNVEFTVENSFFINLSTSLIALLMMTLSQTLLEVHEIKYGKPKQAVIETSTAIITCEDSLIYLGRLKENTFIYNRKLKQSIILDNSDIKKITFLTR